jgi:hypothetical protein
MEHQPVDPAKTVLGDPAGPGGHAFHVLQRAVVVADLGLVPLPPGKVRPRQRLLHLRAGEPVALDLGGALPQVTAGRGLTTNKPRINEDEQGLIGQPELV